MDWTPILASSVIAALTAAIVNFLTNLYLKKKEFHNDYKKYVISRRKIAYEYLEPIINAFSEIQYIQKAGSVSLIKTYRILYFEVGQKSFNQELIEKMGNFDEYKFWYSNALKNKVAELFAILIRIEQETNDIGIDGIYIHNTLEAKIVSLEKEIAECFFRDLINLYDIDSFVKERGRGQIN